MRVRLILLKRRFTEQDPDLNTQRLLAERELQRELFN